MVELLQVKFIGLELNVGFFTLERKGERERVGPSSSPLGCNFF